MNLSNKPDSIEYARDNIATGAYSRQELVDSISQLLDKKSHIDDKRKAYVENLLYKIDGQASGRIVSTIDHLIKLR